MVHPGPSRKLRRELRGAFREERRTRAGPVPALFFRPSRMPTRMSDIEIPDRLVDDIIAGDCVAFVGAGFTAPVLPEWRQLLVDLAAETDQATAEGVRRFVESGTNRDLGAAAQTLRDRLGDDYFFHLMEERLADPPINDVMRRRLRLLHGIPFRAILTTNFDEVLPGELPNRDAFLAVLRPEEHRWWDHRFWDEDAPGATVVKLHGSIRTPGEVVFTHRDYRRLYASPAYATFLRSVMTSTTVLYLGFSFGDAYLNELRSEILALLDHRGGDVPVAYAVVNDPTPVEVDYSLEHEGIHVLPVDTAGGSDFSGFDEYLDAIHDRTNPRRILARLIRGRRVRWVGPDHPSLAYLEAAARDQGAEIVRGDPTGDDDLVIVHGDADDLTRLGGVPEIVLDTSPGDGRRLQAARRGAAGYAADWGELLQEIHRLLA